MLSESMQMFQVVPRQTNLSRKKSSDTMESFTSSGWSDHVVAPRQTNLSRNRSGDTMESFTSTGWADHLVVNRQPPNVPGGAFHESLIEDEDDDEDYADEEAADEEAADEDGAIYADEGESISDIDDDGSYGAQGALEEGLSSELPEDTQILTRMKGLLMTEADSIISKKAQQLFAPPKEKKLKEKDYSLPQRRTGSSRLEHIQSMLGELERKQAEDEKTSSTNSSGSRRQTERKPKIDHVKLLSKSSNSLGWQELEDDDDAPTLRPSSTSPMPRRHTETTGARPTTLPRMSLLGNEDDDKDAARDIRDIIHSKTARLALEEEDNAPTLRPSSTSPMPRRHTETTGARPTTLPRMSLLGNEDDDKDAARDIRDIIHSRTTRLVLEAEDNSLMMRRSTTRRTPRRYTETTGARPTTLYRMSSLGNEDDDKEVDREIGDTIYSKTEGLRRQSLLNVVAPDLPAALKSGRRQNVDGYNLDVSSSSRKSALDMVNSTPRHGRRRVEHRNYSRTPPRIRPSPPKESSLEPSIRPESTRTRRSTSREPYVTPSSRLESTKARRSTSRDPSLSPSILESVEDDADSTCFDRIPPIRGLPILREVSFRTSNKNATQQARQKRSEPNQSLNPMASFSSPLSMLWNTDFLAELKSTTEGG